MAGAGYKLFNTGDVLTAAQVNTYLQEQTVMVFANSTARTTALSGVLAEGMVSYLQDTNAVEVYNGSAWVGVSGAGDVTEVQAGTGISVASGTGPIPVVTNTMATVIDAKGDLVVGTGADTFARLAVGGTNGHSLQVDSSTATGLKWAAASAGALVLINRNTFSNAAGVNIDNVFTSTYQNYLVVIEELVAGTGTDDLYFQWRYGGTTQTSSYYGNLAHMTQSSTSWTITAISNASQATLSLDAGGGADQTSTHFWVARVGNASERPMLNGAGFTITNWLSNFFGCGNNTAQIYDGFRLSSSSTNITGTVTTYGLATS